MDKYLIRNTLPTDHQRVISVMPDWWDGRDLRSMLPKVFFVHFCSNSFVVEASDQLIGFLVGFMSQTDENVGYIHFAGVHPQFRKEGIGRKLYNQFFKQCELKNRTIIRACTSPVNKLSITFHQRMGFIIEAGDGEIDGIPVTSNYLEINNPKVLFRREI
ncbi:GNAT family N-acetyltransferase [Desulfospira joergensenii]|uniref:GNAT family N-acetyltransferase n=1 Tax=Desulfospira joergensenii TaxID=53329 RepID=UPI0003B513F5|nr:GNAT family N-acetyltransferase [Desulfospira joergensenii]